MKGLTKREQQVCDHLMLGETNKEIGMSLGISPRTVEWHREEIFKKHDVHNVVELVRAVYHIGEHP